MDIQGILSKPLLDSETIQGLKEVYTTSEDLAEMVTLFLADADKHIGEIEHAFNDPDALRHAAHSLKGSSGVMGALRLAEVAFQLELCGRTKNLIFVPQYVTLLKKVHRDTITEIRTLA